MAIVSNPRVMMGKPTITAYANHGGIDPGTASGWRVRRADLEANPRLASTDIREALAFAAQVLHADVVYPVPADAA